MRILLVEDDSRVASFIRRRGEMVPAVLKVQNLQLDTLRSAARGAVYQ